MGGDGGVTPNTRADMLKKKSTTSSKLLKQQAKDRTTMCALTKLPIEYPACVGPCGNMFTQVEILKSLASKTLPQQFSFIKRSKQLTVLAFEPNPSYSSSSPHSHPRWICPFTQVPLDGLIPAKAFIPCGHVVSNPAISNGAIIEGNCALCGLLVKSVRTLWPSPLEFQKRKAHYLLQKEHKKKRKLKKNLPTSKSELERVEANITKSFNTLERLRKSGTIQKLSLQPVPVDVDDSKTVQPLSIRSKRSLSSTIIPNPVRKKTV